MTGIQSDKSFYRSDNVGTDGGVNTAYNTSNTLPEFTVFNPKWTQRAINIVDSQTKSKNYPGPVQTNRETTRQSRLAGKRLALNQSSPRYNKAKYVYDKLMSYPGMTDSVALLLTLQAGAESGYNPKPSSSFAPGGGLGGWISSNRGAVLDYINNKYGKNYSRIDDIPLDQQIDALKWFYYDKNKNFVDSHLDDVAILSKYGFSPAITKTGSWTNSRTVKTYTNTPEGWTAYMNDTGNNPNKRWATYEDSILARINNAGMILQ